MAIDTRNKRQSVISAFNPSIFAAPVPDGSLNNAADRQHVLWAYRGILADPPAVRVFFERLVPPNPTQPILDQRMAMTNAFRSWTQLITLASPITGEGSPEGIVEAQRTRFYMDTSGIAGAIMYVKRNADISGDRTKGWILI